MDDHFTIEGTKSTETRLNIDEFSTAAQYEIRWHLFLRALSVVLSAPPENPLGFYRIAGIHGWPIVTWPQLQVEPGKTIYCSHGNARFVTWHRPYLLLLEEQIVGEAHTLAARAPRDKVAQYLEEARKVRIPFWDWADKPALPAAATSATVLVKIPEQGNTPISIPNPLYSYHFTGLYRAPAGPVTTRFPDATVKTNLENSGLKPLVYHALTRQQVFAPFSNTRFPNGTDSIETPHNSVHNAVSAIMQDPLVTAFDPLFWPFHTVIDYYYSLWQAVNLTVLYSDNQPNTNTIDYPLPPFNRRRPFRSWTSRMIQRSATENPNSWASGVQYPETTPTSTVADAQRAINRYAPTRLANTGLPGEIPPDAHRLLPGYPEDLPSVASIRREWRVVIKVKNNLVASNFTIYFFLGQPGALDQWSADEATVGSFSTFKAPVESCENCRTAEGAYMYGSVYLTDELYKRLPSNIHLENPGALQPWLTEKLDWGIRAADGTEFTLPPGGDGTSLYVGVESFMEAYAPPNDGDKPVDYDLGKILGRTFDHKRHVAVTRGKHDKGGEIIAF